MKKLTQAQLQSISKKHGLFSAELWVACLSYLFASQSQSDPPNSDGWNAAMQLARSFVDWVLTQAQKKYGRAAQACLRAASSQCMEEEFLHAQNVVPCVFSHRTTPELRVCKKDGKKRAFSQRLHRRFYTWKIHPETGLPCPEYTAYYVYESHFSHVLDAAHIVGRLPDILRDALAKHEAAPSTSDPFWKQLHDKIKAAMYVLWLTLDDSTSLR
jgi:hypothetical protein